jgi:hypothetical protein
MQKSAPASRSSCSPTLPVDTPMVTTPAARPASMSVGLSPTKKACLATTSTCVSALWISAGPGFNSCIPNRRPRPKTRLTRRATLLIRRARQRAVVELFETTSTGTPLLRSHRSVWSTPSNNVADPAARSSCCARR